MSTRKRFPVGNYFLTFHDDGRWNWAGQVESKISGGLFEVVIFDALFLNMTGQISESQRRVIPLDAMTGWEFQATEEGFWLSVEREMRRCDERAERAGVEA
jgi:hypothetical protein